MSHNRSSILAITIGALLCSAAHTAAAQESNEPGGIRFFGSIYAKFLDGDRRTETALYSNAETTPGEGGSDQGQGIELELMFNAAVSRQVEIGGRLHSRFNRNFWANFGGFEVPDGDSGNGGEDDPRENQYIKLRGAWARLTPGYDWIDSATIGSNDWGMFDPFTQGKYRYIDRDNASGFLFQGSALDRALRWDLARVTLSRLYQGPQFNTGELYGNDASYVLQLGYAPAPSWSITGIAQYVRDKEIDPTDTSNLNGLSVNTRYQNSIFGLKGRTSALGFMDIGAAYYDSSYTISESVCDFGLNGNCRFSPLPKADTDGESYYLNLDFNNLGVSGLSLSAQLFHIGADYVSVTSSRREADVLLTEGMEGTWQWGRPDYNFGNPNNGNSIAGLGYGGWNGEVQQVVSGMADNDFTDFDEPVAYSVIGWEGFTLIPKFTLGGWEFAAEYTFVDFDTNWQACGNNTDKDVDCIYPRMDGTHAWGVGGDYRSPYAPYQEREMDIIALHVGYTVPVGSGIELGLRYKYINDEDQRVTNAALLPDAYDGYPEAAGFALNPNWTPNIGLNGCVSCDDREAEYNTYGLSVGYQLTQDLHGRLIYELHTVDLIDGTIDVAPVGMGFEASNDFGYAEYLTGENTKNRVGLEFSYFLSGVEFGGAFDYFWGEYEPEFYTDSGGARAPLAVAPGATTVSTPLGDIPIDKTDYEQYRMKIFMKVSF